MLKDNNYVFKPHEMPFMVGSPALPEHTKTRQYLYFLLGILVGLTGGFQNGLLLAVLPQIQGELALTPTEGGWLVTAYMMTNSCMSILLFKIRQHFGLTRFVRWIMLGLVVVNLLQLFNNNFYIEILARAISGIVGSGMNVLALFYFLQAMPVKLRSLGMVLGIGMGQIAIPLARVIAPLILQDNSLYLLYLFNFGCSILVFGATALLPLPPGIRAHVFEKLDIISFILFAVGVSGLACFFILGRIVWWQTEWLAYALIVGLLSLLTVGWIEYHRKNPMLHIRWITTRQILAFALVGALLRVLLAEQNVGVPGILTILGYTNYEQVGLYGVITLMSLVGLMVTCFTLNPADLRKFSVVALALIAIGSLIDVGISSNQQPADFYLSQSVMACAAIIFMGPMMMEGFLRAITQGSNYIISFSAVFGLSQSIGGIAGSWFFSLFVNYRNQAHLWDIGDRISLTNPMVEPFLMPTNTLSPNIASNGQAYLVSLLNREAVVMAYNDLFALIAGIAVFLFFVLGGIWLRNKLLGVNPLAKELSALQAARPAAHNK